MRKKYDNKTCSTEDSSFNISAVAYKRFKSFCESIIGTGVYEVPSEQSLFMKESLSIVHYATFIFLATNGFYLIKDIVANKTHPINMIPLYMMVSASIAMLIFTSFYKKYDSPLARIVFLSFYTIVIASVTVFMVSCNFHGISLSISMCYLFVLIVAPTYHWLDTVIVCLLVLLSWWLPGKLPYAENYDLLRHFLIRASILTCFVLNRFRFIRQAYNERYIIGLNNTFIKLAYNDTMTGTLNKKAMEVYCSYITEKMKPEKVSMIIYDVDDFKSYNDHYSHMKGDEALRIVAESLVNVLDQSDRYLFRFGGEEFVVILPDVEEEKARIIAYDLLEAVRKTAIPRDDVPEKNIVTASFGVACGTSEELRNLSIFAKADQQLYVCKGGGKNCVTASGVIYK